ncbi:MAG: NIPSNAP family protein [Acidobacteriota bacterium]|nr:NIPSNAP family protein [Acidobacteriota bacterium]
MTSSKRYLAFVGITVFVAGFSAGIFWQPDQVQAQGNKVFELRTYTTADGKLPNLNARFRDHTMRIFDRHNMENIGYWVPQDTPNTLVYIIAHDSREAAQENWGGFREDAEWPGVAQASGVGRVQVESVFMEATDYSPMQ